MALKTANSGSIGANSQARFSLRIAFKDAWRWPGQRRAAARAADEIIRRAARRDADQDGNVIRPKAFHEGRGPRKPH